MPILIGFCAHARRRDVGPPRPAPTPPATATFRNSRRLMIDLLAHRPARRPDYSLGIDTEVGSTRRRADQIYRAEVEREGVRRMSVETAPPPSPTSVNG